MDELLYGRNPVQEALKSDISVGRVYLLKDGQHHNKDIVALAKMKGIVVDYVDRITLDKKAGNSHHQGVVAEIAPIVYLDWRDLLANADQRGEVPLLLLLDHIEDPHNLGAIIRSALCFGVHGIVLPKKRSVHINATVIKASAGAALHMPVAMVANLAQTMDSLKEQGLWIAGTDAKGELLRGHAALAGPLAVVIGNEGKGLGALVAQKCDFILRIPMENTLNSLNASVAAGIVLYDIVQQRRAL